MTSRSFVFTLWDYTLSEQVRIYKFFQENNKKGLIRYLCYGKEESQDGRPHLQGYLEVGTEPIRGAGLKKLFEEFDYKSFHRIHIEPKKRESTRDQARNYTKKEGKWIEFGNWKAGGQGARNDLIDAIEFLKKKTEENNLDVTLECMDRNPMEWAKYGRFMEKYQAAYEKKLSRGFRKLEVVVNYGDAGVGKTREVVEECEAKNDYPFIANADEDFVFDGYDGEKVLLIDDFKGQIKYKKLLRILDGYQYRCNVKGSCRYARWNKVVITANDRPEDWYKYGLTDALNRRLKTIRHTVKSPML